LNNDILPGVTRSALIALCRTNALTLEQRRFSLDEALEADEALITGASSHVIPVIRIDAQTIGPGRPGEWTRALQSIYLEFARESLI
jgi:D-alanine transaminase